MVRKKADVVGKKLDVKKKQVKKKPVDRNSSPEKKDVAKKGPTTALLSAWKKPIFKVPMKLLPKSLHPET